MRSRAVRSSQDLARWEPEALQVTLFPLWAPHLSLTGRLRLHRPAHE